MRARGVLLLAILAAAPLAVHAQTPPPTTSAAPPALGEAYEADLLEDLPASDNLFLVLETIQASLISDRFSGGGLYTGQAARVGGFLGSWNQTLFRLGEASVTDPTGGGVPLLFPDLMLWRRVQVATGMLPAALNATGLAITLEPRKPSATWTATARGALSHLGLAGGASSGTAPSIARLDGWDRAAAVASGPLIPGRLGAVVAGAWTRGSQVNRSERAAVDATVRSAFTHLLFSSPTGADEVGAIGWLQRTEYPFEHRVPFQQPTVSTADEAAHVQVVWTRRTPGGLPWRTFGSYTRRSRTVDGLGPASISNRIVFERLADGPVSEIAAAGPGVVGQWAVGVRVGPSAATGGRMRHALQGGIELGGSEARAGRFVAGAMGELVDGVPARVWTFADPEVESRRHDLTIGVHLSDRIELTRRLNIDAGLRFDSLSASADGAATSVRWRSWMPRAIIRWAATARSALFAGYARAAYRLPLDVLAIGDPGAPTADIFRWAAPAGVAPALTALGPLVARAGPGTGGDAEFSRIDRHLKRPTSDELVLGLDIEPRGGMRFRLAGVARKERDLIGLVNTGAPASAYSLFSMPDPGADVGLPDDDRLVPVYDRSPETFGADRYVLTNPGQEAATFKGLELSARASAGRLVLQAGATAGIAEGSAAHRGFGPIENDQSRVGELFATPNAATFARGRLFSDRAYTVKLAGVYRFPKDVRLGMVARYQDGQPFARVLVFPALNQGAEAVRAFANGESRFTFTGTLDARLQKGFTLGSQRVDAIADAYNLLNLSYEVEERTAAAPDVRIPTAVQPPRAFHIGLRVTF